MKKRILVLALIFSLLLGVLSPGLLQAQTGIAVSRSSVQTEFPYAITFSLSASSDADITDVRLRYSVEQISYAHVTSEIYILFQPSTSIEVSWTLDMVKTGGLPPGSTLEYWWVLEDARGERLETTPSQVQFDDDRYSWRSLIEGQITIFWYEGGQSFVLQLMESARQALARLNKDTGAYPDKPVRLYIYADAEELKGSMIFPQEWTGGVSFTRYGVIAIGISPDGLDWGNRAIAHELTHLVIHQMTFNPYTDLPTWLDEGLAMYTEGELDDAFKLFLQQAIADRKLISVRSLASPFSAYAEESYLSYAQSYSIIEFLIESYGHDKMLELLKTFKQGNGYDEALTKVYGFDMDGLDMQWLNYISGAGSRSLN